jgi:hypothetical protein
MKWILPILIFAAAEFVQAAELYQPGLPTRCLAMGTTCISHVRGAEALFINPAALARVDGFDFIVAQAEAGASKVAVDFAQQFQGDSFSSSDLNQLYGKTLTADITARSGFVMPYFGFGVFSNNYTTMQFNDPTYPTFHMNFISDYGYVVGGALPLGPQTSLGLSVRHTKRWGGTQDIAVSSVIGSSSQDLANNNFQDHGVGLGMDVSLLTTLDIPLKPTLTFVWQDVGVTTFSQASGNQPPPTQYDNLSFGASIEQQAGIFNFTHAFEYKYIRTEGYDLSQKLHLGTEASLGPLDLRAGISQGYLTYGFGLDLWLFQIDAAAYATELGTYAGQSKSDRYNISITYDLDLDQSFKLKDSDGKKRRLKQRR